MTNINYMIELYKRDYENLRMFSSAQLPKLSYKNCDLQKKVIKFVMS